MAKPEEKPAKPEQAITDAEVESGLDHIISKLPASASLDADEGAMFGMCMTRVKDWLERHNAPASHLAKRMDEIQTAVKKEMAKRNHAASQREADVSLRQKLQIEKALKV